MKGHLWIHCLVALTLTCVITGCTPGLNQAANHVTNAAGYTLNAIGGGPTNAVNGIHSNSGTTSPRKLHASVRVDDQLHSVQLQLADTSLTDQGGNSSQGYPPTLNIPLGWRVYVTLTNSSTEHSAMIVQYDNGLDAQQMIRHVLGKGETGNTQSFLFKARTPGDFAVVCANPNHHDGVLSLIRVVGDRDRPSLTL